MSGPVLEVHVGARKGWPPGHRGEMHQSFVVPAARIKDEEGTWIWAGELEPGERAVFKAYGHRSIFSRLRSPLYYLRVEREYAALTRLEAAGVPCTPPLLWGRGRSPEHGRFELLVVREIPGARSLRDHVRGGGGAPGGADLDVLFSQVRRMHRLGVYHGALSWKNVLVVPTAGRGDFDVSIVDFAKALLFRRDIGGTRMARSDLLHLTSHLREFIPVDDLRGLLEEYGIGAGEAERLTSALRRYPASSFWRKRLYVEFALRSLVSRPKAEG